MARAIEQLSVRNIPFRVFAEVGQPAERIAVVAEREQVDEVMMGVGRHPAWLRWLNPSIAQAVMERTDIPVTVLARGHAGARALRRSRGRRRSPLCCLRWNSPCSPSFQCSIR